MQAVQLGFKEFRNAVCRERDDRAADHDDEKRNIDVTWL